MEAYAIAKTCWYFNVDFDCYKYVTDYIGVDSENDWKTRVAEGKQYGWFVLQVSHLSDLQ